MLLKCFNLPKFYFVIVISSPYLAHRVKFIKELAYGVNSKHFPCQAVASRGMKPVPPGLPL